MTPRGRRIALAASLLGNVFACGVIGGGVWMVQRPGASRPSAPLQQRPIRSAGAELPEADRQRFEETIRRVLQGGRDLQRTAVSSRREAAALFAEPTFDQDAVARLLEQGRTADATLQARLDNAAIDFAASLPLDERTTLARGLARGGPLRHPRP